MAIRILISGGGIGGLCLAQGLHKNGVAVEVFERDASSDVRGQGFRFRMDANGDTALRTCLDKGLYELYRATSNQPAAPPSAAYDHQMQVIFRMDPSDRPVGSAQHVAVNRATLREVLMSGLEDVLRFGHTIVRVEQSSDQVTALFANGKVATGDLLIAADGIGSVVRRQIRPQAEPMDTGMRCIYGHTPLDRSLLDVLPEIFFAGFVPFAGPQFRTLAMGMFRSRQPMAEATAQFFPRARLTPVQDYMMWLCVAPLGAFAMSDEELRMASCATLHKKALELTGGWHQLLRHVLERADIGSLFQVPIRTSTPMTAWPVTRVTFLGDAIHAMTPAGGIGANTALRDAELLTKMVSAANRDERDLQGAVAQYEAEMRVYGTAAIQQSIAGAHRLYRISPPALVWA